MSAAADPPVHSKIEVTGDSGQPGVTPSGHETGDDDPARGTSLVAGKGSKETGDDDPARGTSLVAGKGSEETGDDDPARGTSLVSGKGSTATGKPGPSPKGSYRYALRRGAGGYRDLALPPAVSDGLVTNEVVIDFDGLDPEVSAALERSLAASGMERVLDRVLRGKVGDPPTSKPAPGVPYRDYVSADGTVLRDYFGDTDDEHMHQDDLDEPGSAEFVLAQRQHEDVPMGPPPLAVSGGPDEEDEDLDFQSAGDAEEGSAEFIVSNGGDAAPTLKPNLLEQADLSAGTAFSRESQSAGEIRAALDDSEFTESFRQTQGSSVNALYDPPTATTERSSDVSSGVTSASGTDESIPSISGDSLPTVPLPFNAVDFLCREVRTTAGPAASGEDWKEAMVIAAQKERGAEVESLLRSQAHQITELLQRAESAELAKESAEERYRTVKEANPGPYDTVNPARQAARLKDRERARKYSEAARSAKLKVQAARFKDREIAREESESARSEESPVYCCQEKVTDCDVVCTVTFQGTKTRVRVDTSHNHMLDVHHLLQRIIPGYPGWEDMTYMSVGGVDLRSGWLDEDPRVLRTGDTVVATQLPPRQVTGTRRAEPLDTAGSAGSDLLGLFDLAVSVAVPAPAKPPSSPTAPGVYAVSGAAVMPRTKGCCPGHSVASPGGRGPCSGSFATGASFNEVSSIMPVCAPPPSVCEMKPISPTDYVAAHNAGRSPRHTVSASVEAPPSDGDDREVFRFGAADDDADRDSVTTTSTESVPFEPPSERVTACVIIMFGAADTPDCEPLNILKSNRGMHGSADYRRMQIELKDNARYEVFVDDRPQSVADYVTSADGVRVIGRNVGGTHPLLTAKFEAGESLADQADHIAEQLKCTYGLIVDYEPGRFPTRHNQLNMVDECKGGSSDVSIWACSLTAVSLEKIPAALWKSASDSVPGCPITLCTLRDATPASSVPGLSDSVMQGSIKRTLILYRKGAVGKTPEEILGGIERSPSASPSTVSAFGSPYPLAPTASSGASVAKLSHKDVKGQVKEHLAECFGGPASVLETQGTQDELQQVTKLITALTDCRQPEYEHLQIPQLNAILYLVLTNYYCSDAVQVFMASKLRVWRMDGDRTVITYPPNSAWLSWLGKYHREGDLGTEYHRVYEIISSVDDPDPRVLFGRLSPWISEIDTRESDKNSPHRMAAGKSLTANMDESGIGKVLLKLIFRVLSGANDLCVLRFYGKLDGENVRSQSLVHEDPDVWRIDYKKEITKRHLESEEQKAASDPAYVLRQNDIHIFEDLSFHELARLADDVWHKVSERHSLVIDNKPDTVPRHERYVLSQLRRSVNDNLEQPVPVVYSKAERQAFASKNVTVSATPALVGGVNQSHTRHGQSGGDTLAPGSSDAGRSRRILELVTKAPTKCFGIPEKQKQVRFNNRLMLVTLALFSAKRLGTAEVHPGAKALLLSHAGRCCLGCGGDSPGNIFTCTVCAPNLGKAHFVDGLGPQPDSLFGTGLSAPLPSGLMEGKKARDQFQARAPYLVDTSAAKPDSWVKLLSPQFKTDVDSDQLKDACPTGMPSDAGQARAKACFTCGSKDHVQRDCPDKPANAGHGDKSARECWSCGRKGHVRADCPNPRMRSIGGVENGHRDDHGVVPVDVHSKPVDGGPGLSKIYRVGSIVLGADHSKTHWTSNELSTLECDLGCALMYDPTVEHDGEVGGVVAATWDFKWSAPPPPLNRRQ